MRRQRLSPTMTETLIAMLNRNWKIPTGEPEDDADATEDEPYRPAASTQQVYYYEGES